MVCQIYDWIKKGDIAIKKVKQQQILRCRKHYQQGKFKVIHQTKNEIGLWGEPIIESEK
jgi:hypothetical protein